MRYAVYRGERDVEQLVKRVYRIQGRNKADQEKRRMAREALLDANPGLAHTEDLLDGVLLAVPDVPGVISTPPEEPEELGRRVRGLTDDRLSAIGELIADLSAREAQSARELRKQVRRRRLLDVVADDEELAERVKDIDEHTKERVRGAKRYEGLTGEVLDTLHKDFNEMLGHLPGDLGEGGPGSRKG
jgi:hypothetical protein